MSSCDCPVQPHFVPTPIVCPSPINVTSCLNGELCTELVWAECVVYRGVPLPNIGVATNDRLEEILEKLDVNKSTNSIAVQSSQTISLSGNGLAVNPLKGNAIVDTVITDNILIASAAGLKVQLTQPIILNMLNTILADTTLSKKFCDIVNSCSAFTCSLPSGMKAVIN